MILIIAVLAILLLITCAGLYALNDGAKKAHELAEDYKQRWLDELDVSSALRNEKHHEWERAEVLQEQVFTLKQTIADLETELAERPLPAPEAEETELGSFIKHKAIRRATPETYRNVFDLDINGQRVLGHLQLAFANKSTYVRGGHDAERESCFRAGQVDVIAFILKQINIANDPSYDPKKYEEEVND